jgi:hypothetical protein
MLLRVNQMKQLIMNNLFKFKHLLKQLIPQHLQRQQWCNLTSIIATLGSKNIRSDHVYSIRSFVDVLVTE